MGVTFAGVLSSLKQGSLSLSQVIEGLWRQIEELEPRVHAFLSLAEPEKLVRRGEELRHLPLSGLPVAVKDNLTTVDGSQILSHFQPPFDATCVARLKAAGGQVQGKTNLDEFAMGSSTEHSALGTDTGGSVRQPAALCGVVGLRPTYGLVSRFGLVAFASSLDTVGVLARSVRDAALILSIIAGHDPKDATSLPLPPQDYTQGLKGDLEGMRIGLPKEYVPEGLSPAPSLGIWGRRWWSSPFPSRSTPCPPTILWLRPRRRLISPATTRLARLLSCGFGRGVD